MALMQSRGQLELNAGRWGHDFQRMQAEGHPIEATGKKLRGLFAWEQPDTDYVDGSAQR